MFCPILYERTEKSEEKKYKRYQNKMNNKGAIEKKELSLKSLLVTLATYMEAGQVEE